MGLSFLLSVQVFFHLSGHAGYAIMHTVDTALENIRVIIVNNYLCRPSGPFFLKFSELSRQNNLTIRYGILKVFCWLLQQEIAELEGIPVEEVTLYCSGSPLNEDVLIANLQDLSLDISISLKGGKVHGSLARAGKVKGQTPKVSESNESCATLNANRVFNSSDVMPVNLCFWYGN
jgi:hypothetical protein